MRTYEAIALQLVELAAVCLGRSVVPSWFELGCDDHRAWLWYDAAFVDQSETRDAANAIVALGSLHADPSSAVQRWLDIFTTVAQVLNYVRAVRSRRVDLLDARLQTLSFALEGLHRVLHSHERHCPREEFVSLLKAAKPDLSRALATAGASASLRRRVYEAMGQAYELSFRERIAKFSEFVSTYLDTSALRWGDDEAEALKQFRNKLTHPGIGEGWRQADRRAQLELMHKMHGTIRARLLPAIGVPAAVARPAILNGLDGGSLN